MILYLFDKCKSKIDAEHSDIQVGDEGNLDSFLSSLSYEVEQDLAFA
jgi:hypothetical protein